MERKKVAVIGAGHLGKIHAKLLKTIENVEPFVVETNLAARQAVEKEVGVPAFESLSDINQSLDGAIVVTPTQTHYEVAENLINEGCHLFVEKPVCADAESSRRLCERAEQQERILQVGHVERFNPAFVAARPYLTKLQMIECTRHTPYTFRATDVSVIQDLMIHDIDLVLSVIDSELVNVSSMGTRTIGPHWDTAVAWLEFANGAKACLSASRISNRPQRSLKGTHAQGGLLVDFAQQSVEVCQAVDNIYDGLSQLTDSQKASARDEMFGKWLPVSEIEVAPQNAILEEQKEFVACLNGQASPTVSGRDGLAAVEVAEKILEDLEQNSLPANQKFAA